MAVDFKLNFFVFPELPALGLTGRPPTRTFLPYSAFDIFIKSHSREDLLKS